MNACAEWVGWFSTTPNKNGILLTSRSEPRDLHCRVCHAHCVCSIKVNCAMRGSDTQPESNWFCNGSSPHLQPLFADCQANGGFNCCRDLAIV